MPADARSGGLARLVLSPVFGGVPCSIYNMMTWI
jgi:hypothetical protein